MRCFPLLPAAALVGALITGCDDTAGVTTSDEASRPAFRVERFPVHSGFAFPDERRTVFIGFTLQDVIGLCAGTGFNLSEFNELIVIRPDGSLKDQQRGNNVNVVVFDTPAFSCDFDVHHFTGTGHVTTSDNDLLLSGNRANASVVHFTGTVTDESGQRWHLEVIGHQVLDRNSTIENQIQLNSVVRIHLNRIGG